MLQAMLSGVSGMQANQTRITAIGNNVANVNTTGYKAARVTFQDQLSQTLEAASAPTDTTGGTNAQQVGLGVTVGAIGASQAQGNLQTTGKTTDLAIQGNGAFVVSDGLNLHYTRDGSFDVDADGYLVQTGTGMKVIGLTADQSGHIDVSAPITPVASLRIPLGASLPAKESSKIVLSGVLNAADRNFTTYVNHAGNLSSSDSGGTVASSTTVYDANGAAHTIRTSFLNPAAAGANAPTGATRQWDVQVTVDGHSVYDSTAADGKMYFVPSRGWVFADAQGALLPSLSVPVPGSGTLEAFNVQLNTGALTNAAAASSLEGTADGRNVGTANWGNSVRLYDGLGNSHVVSFQYTHVPLGTTPPPPSGATNRWDWTATDENGAIVGSSASAGNTPLFFDRMGMLVGQFSQSLSVVLNQNNGSASPVQIAVDTTKLQQLVGDSSASGVQDGYAAGNLTSFSIGADGVITGTFTSGQSRALGQVVTATFPNPGGLTRSGNNLLDVSSNSGQPTIGVPGTNGRGVIASGYLEGSNVDLAEEFTTMIITQRGYQANTKIITTVDSLLQDVVNLVR